MTIFDDRESVVRSYCRAFPAIFARAKGSYIYAQDGREYIDFLAGAGALNYGHNPEFIKRRIIEYLNTDGLVQGLDFHSVAKAQFLDQFSERVLRPRALDYKVMFCGPTGTNSIEAALKLARKYTGRTGIFSFMGGFHGMSLGSLAATANGSKRRGAGVPLQNVTFLPYPSMPAETALLSAAQNIEFIERMLTDSHSGIDLPAAILFESVQAEGGINIAPIEWMQSLRELCNRHEILLICDDIQAGCGRTGPFFSFERAGIVPDMVTVSKSISGYGAPMALLLIQRQLDIWNPGEHNGTFRGYQLSMVGATAAIELRERLNLEFEVMRKAQFIESFLTSEIATIDSDIVLRGIGLLWGIDFSRCATTANLCERVSRHCFDHGLVIETSGRGDSVLKILPPLTIEDDVLEKGCNLIAAAVKDCI
jgi:diaminobutyrate-2-oxoglutarate transaminase